MTTPTPRKRPSPAVYRRRRLVLLLGVLVVAALVTWLLIAQPWAGNAADAAPVPKTSSAAPEKAATALPIPEGSATPKSTPTESAAASADPGPSSTAKPCVARDITVAPVADQETYPQDADPLFSIALTNNGDDCTLNVGTSTQVFTVTSGEDTWWRSTDCQTKPSDMVVLLAAGQTVQSATGLEWDRTRSSVSTCDSGDRQRAPGGGSSYFLSVEIGGIASTDMTQFLLY